MLFLILQLGADRYAIDAAQVTEVLPLVNVKQVPRAPLGIAGVFNHHGAPVPLIDLAELTLGKQSRKRMSTRIVLVNFRGASDKQHAVGLLAEHATETMRRSKEDFTEPGVGVTEASYFEGAATDAAGIIQRIGIQKLLSQTLGRYLFREQMEPV
jgi:chemotaxis-related protein WspB